MITDQKRSSNERNNNFFPIRYLQFIFFLCFHTFEMLYCNMFLPQVSKLALTGLGTSGDTGIQAGQARPRSCLGRARGDRNDPVGPRKGPSPTRDTGPSSTILVLIRRRFYGICGIRSEAILPDAQVRFVVRGHADARSGAGRLAGSQ